MNIVLTVYMKSEGCPHCREQERLLEAHRPERAEIALVDVLNPVGMAKAKAAGVKSVPTLVLERDGVEVWRRAGLTATDAIEMHIDDAEAGA